MPSPSPAKRRRTTAKALPTAQTLTQNQEQSTNADGPSAPYGPAQEAFIRSTRQAIDAGKLSLVGTNWTCIRPTLPFDQQRATSHYYIKPLAVWVPHLIVPGHVPYCPRCASPDGVDPSKTTRWAKGCRVLAGLHSHRYLDTKLYFCNSCNRFFNGTNPQSMALGNSRLLGKFTFYLPRNANAIDDELYQYIVAQARVPVERIVDKLRQLAMENYNRDLMRYLLDARDGRVLPENAHVARNSNSNNTKKRKRYESHEKFPLLQKLREDLVEAERKAKDDIDLSKLLKLKDARNVVNLDLPCLGRAKLIKIMAEGITTARHFLECAETESAEFVQLKANCKNPSIVNTWVARVKEDLAQRDEKFETLTMQVREIEEELGVAEEDERAEQEELARAAVEEEPRYTSFSTLEDKQGYNARFVYKKAVKDVVADHFSQQRFVYLGRMLKLGGQWLRLHFFHDAGKKIFANKPKTNTRPYRCMAVILNEKGLVIWWAMIPKEGGLDDLFAPLKKLKARLDRLGYTVGSIYAENASICEKLHQIFDVVVLDVFDWLERWNQILVKPTSHAGEVFRALLGRAVLGITLNEFQRSKRQAKSRLNREPTVKETLRECSATLPSAEQQEEDVMNVVYYFYLLDVKAEAQHGVVSKQQCQFRIFKNYNLVAKTVEEQLVCIRSSRLSDQESTDAKRQIQQLWDQINEEVFRNNSTGCGVRRAERDIWSFLDERNSKLMDELSLPRLPEGSPSEMAAQAASIAQSLGMEEPKFQQTDSHQSTSETENLGFDAALDSIEDIEDDIDIEESDDDFDFDEMDEVKVGPPDLPTVVMPVRPPDVTMDDGAQVLEHLSKKISKHARELEHFVSETLHNEKGSSLKAFQSLVDSEQWAQFLETKPFGDGDQDPIENEELLLYEQMESSFDGTSLKSYQQFESSWAFECGQRLKSRCNGGNDILLFRKTTKQLFDQHDFVAAKLRRMREGLSEGLGNINFRNHCRKCAHPKKMHARFEGFGGTCSKGYCYRCGALEKWHIEYGSKMGFYCKLTADQTGLGASKIERFDEQWSSETNTAVVAGASGNVPTREELIQNYTPKSTVLLRLPAPSNLSLPTPNDLPDAFVYFKLRAEGVSTAIIRAVEDRFIVEHSDKVFSPLKLWAQDEREKPEHKLSVRQMQRVHEWCKIYYAVKCLKVLETGVKDQSTVILEAVPAKPAARDFASWLDIAIEVAHAKDLDAKIAELLPAKSNVAGTDNPAGETEPAASSEEKKEESCEEDQETDNQEAAQSIANQQATVQPFTNQMAHQYQYMMAQYAHMQQYMYAAYGGAMYTATDATAAATATAAAAAAPKRSSKKQPTAPAPRRSSKKQPQPKDPLSGTGFRFRTYCKRCGFKIGKHGANEYVGGKCSRSWCCRCGEREEFHTDCPMGPLCTKDKNGRTDPEDWYFTGPAASSKEREGEEKEEEESCEAVAPHAIVPVATARVPPRPLPKDYSKWRYCITCGARKKHHYEGESYGTKCKRTMCTLCNQHKVYHERVGCPMGWYCTLEVKK